MAAAVISSEDVSFVCDLIQRAGAVALSMRDELLVSEKAPGDMVTDADRALSKLIVSELSQRAPRDLIVSEEGDRQQTAECNRTWLIDPIDGTDHFIKKSRHFSVMIGLVSTAGPLFGWVYQPTEKLLYFGGPGYGTFCQRQGEQIIPVKISSRLKDRDPIRMIIGNSDANKRPWLKEMSGLTMRFVGSMGVKVIYVLENRADIVAQMHGKMSVWDTAAPAAIALGAGLEVCSGEEICAGLQFPEVYELGTFKQKFPVIIGRAGTLAWSKNFLFKKPD